MKNSYLLHIDEQTTQGISLEDISFLSSFKANQLEEELGEIYVIEITLSNPGDSQVAALIKIGAQTGEYTGYSVSIRWETAIAKAFECIRHHITVTANSPVPENTN
jgi:hypothetical protein